MAYGQGEPVKAVRVVHRSSGSAWPGDKGRIVRVTGDGYVIRWDEGGWIVDVVKDADVERV